MTREAALFRVEGPRGIYYAVYEAEQQLLFTEANEKGARDHAAEVGLVLSRERSIRHTELMRLTGRDAVTQHREADKHAEKQAKPADPVIRPLEATLPKKGELQNNEIVSTRVMTGTNPFASTGSMKESDLIAKPESEMPADALPSDAVNRDVINFSQMPRTGRRGNPFADNS